MEYHIDATNKILGRLASDIAVKLRGKNAPQFDPSRPGRNRVMIFNTDHLRITGRKRDQKTYYRHSGYPGGLSGESLAHLMTRDSRLAVRRAVFGMLPKNRLRNVIMKNLLLHKKGMEQP